MREVAKLSLKEAVQHARDHGEVAVWIMDPEGQRNIPAREIGWAITSMRREGVVFEVMGTITRLTESGLIPGRMVPDPSGVGWLEGTQVRVGADGNDWGIRIKVGPARNI